MSIAEEMAELTPGERSRLSDQDDAITWKSTEHGRYTSKSAYAVQLAGSYCEFDSMAIWKANTGGKHHFFMAAGTVRGLDSRQVASVKLVLLTNMFSL
jgi:hypothetical protein